MSQNSVLLKNKFHAVHGNDILLSQNATVARRIESCSNGFVFSAKPIKPNTKIFITLLEVSNNLQGVVSVGFTTADPSTLKQDLHECTKKQLNEKHNFWTCSLSRNMCPAKSTLFFYVTTSGHIHFGINGKEKGNICKNVDTNKQLWAVIHIWSSVTTIALVKNTQKIQMKSYTFTPIPLDLKKIVQIKFLGEDSLMLGVTSCNPESLDHRSLPDDPDLLLDREEYWVVIDDASFSFVKDDEVSYIITTNGELKLWKNSSLLMKVIHVDNSAKLWGFFITNKTNSIITTVSPINEDPNIGREKQETCVVCCDKAPEAALYPCGHLCMCFECATKQFKSFKECILCRAKIQDVLKIYK